MKTLISSFLAGSLLAAISCNSNDAKKSATEATPAVTDDTAPASASITPPSTQLGKPAPTKALPCTEWLARDLLKTYCGSDVPFINDNDDPPKRCLRRGQSKEKGIVEVTIETIGKAGWESASRHYPTPPSVETNGFAIVLRTRRFPYVLTLRMSPSYMDSKKSLCTEKQALALVDAIVTKIPEQAEPPSKQNHACDTLLRTIDIRKFCKGKPAISFKSSQIYPTIFEDGKSLYCHRKGRDLIFMVTKHANAKVASAGAAVASEDPKAETRSKGPFVIELKPLNESKLCSKDNLAELANLIASRLPAE